MPAWIALLHYDRHKDKALQVYFTTIVILRCMQNSVGTLECRFLLVLLNSSYFSNALMNIHIQ